MNAHTVSFISCKAQLSVLSTVFNRLTIKIKFKPNTLIEQVDSGSLTYFYNYVLFISNLRFSVSYTAMVGTKLFIEQYFVSF